MLLHAPQDRRLQLYFIGGAARGGDEDPEARRARRDADRARLDRMVAWAQSALCRWTQLLQYFGESLDDEQCGHCDNCTRLRERPLPTALVAPDQPTTGDVPSPTPALRAGALVQTTQHGDGQVVAVRDDKVDVRGLDGTVRTCSRAFNMTDG